MGEVFAGRYELVEPIGHGGMGTVWVAWDRRDECYRAAKVLRQADAASLLRFVREQSFRISHPHCVTPRGWAGEDDRVLFTMDLVRGGSVATLIGDYGPLPSAWAAVLLDQLLSALRAVHDSGLVHRDVKPANLLLEPTGRTRPHLRLGDFGVAVPVDEPRMTRSSTVLGTPGYLAPEQVRGDEPDPRTDLWGAGVVLAEMLTGERLRVDATCLPAAPPAGVDPDLWGFARTLTAPDPADRPGSAAHAREVLAATVMVPAGTPDDDGRGIEVLEHVALPDDPGPLPPRSDGVTTRPDVRSSPPEPWAGAAGVAGTAGAAGVAGVAGAGNPDVPPPPPAPGFPGAEPSSAAEPTAPSPSPFPEPSSAAEPPSPFSKPSSAAEPAAPPPHVPAPAGSAEASGQPGPPGRAGSSGAMSSSPVTRPAETSIHTGSSARGRSAGPRRRGLLAGGAVILLGIVLLILAVLMMEL